MNENTHEMFCMSIHICMYIHIFKHIHPCVHTADIYTHIPSFSTKDVTPLNYKLKTQPGTRHSYKRNQTMLYSINKVKYSCALVLSNILFRESPTRGHERTQKIKFKKAI